MGISLLMGLRFGYLFSGIIIAYSFVAILWKLLAPHPQNLGQNYLSLLVVFIFVGMALLEIFNAPSHPKEIKTGLIIMFIGVAFNRLLYWIFPQQVLIKAIADIIMMAGGIYGLFVFHQWRAKGKP